MSALTDTGHWSHGAGAALSSRPRSACRHGVHFGSRP